MPTLKEYDVKLTRLRNTRKLTRTMKLVSVNKLRHAQEAEKRVAGFRSEIDKIVARLVAGNGAKGEQPLLIPHPTAHNILILIIASDRGLCGGFNNTLFHVVMDWIGRHPREVATVKVSCCGRKAHTFLKTRVAFERFYDQAASRPDYSHARHIGHDLIAGFMSKRLDEVYVAWNKTFAAGNVIPTIERFIPMSSSMLADNAVATKQWLVEPDPTTLLESALPNLITLYLYQAMLSSATGEHGARMLAMEHASSNADGLIRKLTLQRNRARQAQITTELTEIVAGAEALR